MNENDQLNRVLEKIQEIVEKSANGDYIYRGEPKHYCKVSSGLYREYSKIEAENFDIEIAQEEILKDAKDYTSKTDDFEILTELQHYGGATNLIDFTTDYLIALFFACDRHLDKDGRIILIPNTNPRIAKPRNPINRVIAQKSRFIRPPKGFIEPSHIIDIPQDLKHPILDYLRKYHGISTKTIYNDLHGFIRYQKAHKNAYTEFFYGLTYQKDEDYSKAIEHYSNAIELDPLLAIAYNNRGGAYHSEGKYDYAIEDFSIAIGLNRDDAGAYCNRGIACSDNGQVEQAMEDLNKAIELKPDYADAYQHLGIEYAKQGKFNCAIQAHNKAIEITPYDATAYNNRGNTYLNKGEFERALEDFNKAIELDPNDALAYYNCGETWLRQKKWHNARSDLVDAINKGVDIIAEFREAHTNVEKFEQKYDVKLPEDITAMLKEIRMNYDIDVEYQVENGDVCLTVSIGDGQDGSSVARLDGQLLTLVEIQNKHVGSGQDLIGKTLKVITTIRNILEETDRTSVTWTLTGGTQPLHKTCSKEVENDGAAVIYRAWFTFVES